MQKLSFLLALAALGLAAYAAVVTTGAVHESKTHAEAEAGFELRLLALETALGARPDPKAPALATVADGGAPAGAAAAGGSAPGALAGAARPATLPEMAKRLEALEAKLHEGPGEVVAPGQIATPAEPLETVSWVSNVDEAGKAFDLTPSQRAEFDRVLADAKRDSTDLHKLPDENGRTWDQAQKESVEVKDGNISFDGTKVQEFREKMIPGRSESYGAADRRIRAEAKRKLRDSLSPHQQAKFDKTQTDGLLPGGGGFGDFSFITFAAPALAPAPEPVEPAK